ncbi:ankyrin repeat domain-containing protein [Wolbachia endosymbiont (group A) of Anomoia purmunda]|uniref:ankyrin repeat domain-containing protein n=1 Tax=Wolbachia endosymbiont (group A) of Anomoia purmunda TaxID=2953978 RepID=UPI0022317AD4|nr:ankyrin repeat domain-containing protein [Wolbachia endosymbiont (group A) of Anomoia purmunda]
MLTRDIPEPEQVSSAKTNPEINETLEGLPKKLEKEERDDEYELIKKHLFSLDSRLLIDSKLSFQGIVCTWIACTPDLTDSQKKLNRELLNILKGLDPCYYNPKEDRHCEYYVKKFTEFLRNNRDNQDLKAVLNLKRGESGLTVLHVVSSVGNTTKEYNETVDLLLEAGANPDIQNNKGKTPLHYTDVLASVASLLKGKANPNIQDNEGETPLHYAASIGHTNYVNLLLEKKANPNIQNRKGGTPLQVAIDNHHYYIEECFFTDNQKNLSKELYSILDKCFDAYENCIWSKDKDRSGYVANFINFTKSLKEFLDKHRNSEDLKIIFSIRDAGGGSRVLNHARYIDKKVVDLLLSAGAVDPCKEGGSLLDCGGSFYNVGEKYRVKSILWSTPNQVKLNEFLGKVSKAQGMYKLGEVVNEAIKSGVRFDFSQRLSQDEKAYNFIDCVMKRIGELEKNPKVASDIICKLVSRGAVFGNKVDIDVIDTLDEFKDHKANMIKAYADYISNAHKFIEVAKSATSSELNDVRIGNSTFYLEYSEDSKIDVAKITDGARNLGLTQGEIEYGRDIIKIGKSEVEIITQNGIRNYTDLADNSDIVLTFYISEGELEVRLYPDMRNKDLIRVEMNNQGLLERLKNCDEKIGKNCLLGGLPVNQAIEQGFFVRSGKLMRSETMSQSNGKTEESWCEKISKASNSEQTTSRA